MLHIVFVTHTPLTCPGADADVRVKALAGLSEVEKACAERGMRVVGGWVDRPAHALYFIVDAPNAHEVTKLAVDLKFSDWSTVDVNPVIEVGELRDALGQMVAAGA